MNSLAQVVSSIDISRNYTLKTVKESAERASCEHGEISSVRSGSVIKKTKPKSKPIAGCCDCVSCFPGKGIKWPSDKWSNSKQSGAHASKIKIKSNLYAQRDEHHKKKQKQQQQTTAELVNEQRGPESNFNWPLKVAPNACSAPAQL